MKKLFGVCVTIIAMEFVYAYGWCKGVVDCCRADINNGAK